MIRRVRGPAHHHRDGTANPLTQRGATTERTNASLFRAASHVDGEAEVVVAGSLPAGTPVLGGALTQKDRHVLARDPEESSRSTISQSSWRLASIVRPAKQSIVTAYRYRGARSKAIDHGMSVVGQDADVPVLLGDLEAATRAPWTASMRFA